MHDSARTRARGEPTSDKFGHANRVFLREFDKAVRNLFYL